MKKIFLLAALLGGVSFASIASAILDKKEGISARANTHKTVTHNSDKLKKQYPEGCGFSYFSTECDGETWLGSAYTCNSIDALQAQYDFQEEHCPN